MLHAKHLIDFAVFAVRNIKGDRCYRNRQVRCKVARKS